MSETNRVALHWFRRDLRLSDNPALREAYENADCVIPLYIWSPDEYGDWAPGAASRWWLHHSLTSLRTDLQKQGANLIIRQGASEEIISALIKSHNVSLVTWNRLYIEEFVKRDKKIKAKLQDTYDCEVVSKNGSTLLEPWEHSTGAGDPYKVFTPYWKSLCKAIEPQEPLPAATKIQLPKKKADSLKPDDLNLLPSIGWDEAFPEHWTPGEKAAQKQLKEFKESILEGYPESRDRPAQSGTSRLSPHLHFGELSPRQIWFALKETEVPTPLSKTPTETYLREIGWRDFANQLLFYFPHTALQPLREEFKAFPWKRNKKLLRAWQKGNTGYPIVDAGMRELWATGWMHNRVRMIVASFLVKHLLQPWQDGAKWFWDTLVDADLGSNTLGWQWSAGSGADAAPYFRIFNPILQGEKFDADGAYVKRWVPELEELAKKYIHKPWEAPDETLRSAGIVLGKTYPEPIVDHKRARKAALEAYDELKSQK